MTTNFVYTPHPQNSAPIDYRNSPYLGHFYHQTNSPFIPPLSLNASPFHSPYGTPALGSATLPPSPNLASSSLPAAFTPFPTSGDYLSYQPFVPQPEDPWHRERRSSWNEQPAPLYRPPPVRQRTRSFNDNPYPAIPFSPPAVVSPYANPYSFRPTPPTSLGPVLHPYLDGSRFRGDVFDLAAPEFRPLRLVGHNQLWPLTYEELSQLATEPQMYKLTISCDVWIPEWPLHLDFRSTNPYDSNVPPIKLGDVLTAIHGSLHKRISQYDWAQLPPEHEYQVSKAYTKRCKTMGPDQLKHRNQGVKQVDFLMGKTKFRGLVKVGDSHEHLKLLVG